PGAVAGRGLGYPESGRETPVGSGGAVRRGQNGCSAAVCRRADEDVAGLSTATGRGGPVCAHRAAARGGDSGYLTGCAHGPAGSAPDGQRGGAARGGAGAGVSLCAAPGHCPAGRGDLTGGAGAVGGSRAPLSTGATATGQVYV